MKRIKHILLAMLMAFSGHTAMQGADYGLPAQIQDGNILHCFNWPVTAVKEALPEIAAAGFGSVQLSPLQRADVSSTGTAWHNLYRPYDLAFKPSGFCSEAGLKDLCDEAAKYGIKVIVDVVANHVDKTAGYHDTWWDANGRVRFNGSINYGDRYSITHGQLGDYGDINSELSEVCERGKAYVEKLKSLGVKGCRWDAAKHIGLPSESCNFWSSVTSVPGMWHYGEMLDAPGPNKSLVKEYVKYMSITDNQYSNGGAKDNGGVFMGYGGDWAVNQGISSDKLVYWAESHDTYANDQWSQNVDQSVIDRAYACIACRNGAAGLYLSRPTTKGFNNIKTGKGSTAFTAKHIAAVNAFRNAAGSQPDYCEAGNGTFTVTRKDFGAVIVMKGSGNVSVKNGGAYCPAGTYQDKITGNTFTVTATTISGTVGSTGIAVIYNGSFDFGGSDTPTPDPTPGTLTIPGDYNLAYSGNKSKVYYWGGVSKPDWPGVAMQTATGSDGKSYKVFKLPEGTTNVIFNSNGDSDKTVDLVYKAGYVHNDNGPTSTPVTFGNAQPTKPVVTATPAGGNFTGSVTVSLSVSPATDIYYTTNGSTPTASSSKYTGALTFTETTTLKTYVKNEAGENVQTFTYTKNSGNITSSENAINTDYYKINPNGQVGTNRTVNTVFNKVNNDNRMCVATNALSNWTEQDLICQGVARDIASAIKGKHEYPVIDSYAIYAAYDKDNLYLGVQYVYTVWDLYGDGKADNLRAKPYQMDGRIMIAFDLDPYKEFEGILTNGNTIWDADGQYNTFDNGTDCIWLGSTKPTVGTPGLFFPDANGKASYDSKYCVGIDAPFYGCQDGLLPSIKNIWGQKDFEYDAEVLKGNEGFADLINEIDKSQHTFYEFKFPLAKLGITEDYIKNTGIGVMVIDTYGQGAIGSTPYDPTTLDNAKTPYSKDESSSAEKEDADVFTYAHARIGKLLSAGINDVTIDSNEDANAPVEYYNLQGVRVHNPAHGLYIKRQGKKVTKVLMK